MKKQPTIFQKNCEKWAQTDPKKAVLLPYVDCKDLEFCQTDQNELNLKFVFNHQVHFFYSSQGAMKEATDWFTHLQLTHIPLIYVYGVGLGYYYQAAKNWLQQDPSRRIVFIEDNLAVIHRLFETELGTQLIQDPQVQLHFFEGMEKSKELFNVLYWNFFLTTLTVSALKLYAKVKETVYIELQHKIHYDASLKNSLLTEYLEYGTGFFKNFYPNILCLEGSYLADNLFGKFKNIPAIICGAGPSLEKNIQVLTQLSHKAIIFAGGSAINAINKEHLQPHFAAGIDPNAPQYDRVSTNTAYEVPFLYRNRLLHKAFRAVHGPLLYVTGSGGYDISTLFEEAFNIQGKRLEEGHNVVNFCLEVAHAMGCNPIIFVGMDLAYTHMKAYAPGVVEQNTVDAETIVKEDQVDHAALLKQDIYGEPIYTLWKWMAESEWIGDFAKNDPDTIVINATEGGLGFPGVPNMTLKEVEKNYLKSTYDLKGMIHSEIMNSSLPQVKTEQVLNIMKDLSQSLERCEEDLSVLIEESEVIKARIKKEKKVPTIQQTGKASLYETELAEESGYQYVLQIFNEAYTRVLNRELQALNHLSEIKQVIGKIDILIKRFAFLRNVSRVNRELIKMAIQDHKPRKALSHIKPGKITHREKKVSGRREGESIYQADHHLLSKVNFHKGLPDGKTELYYPNGQLYSVQQFKSGLWHGPQYFYYPDGSLKTYLEYSEGQLKKADLGEFTR